VVSQNKSQANGNVFNAGWWMMTLINEILTNAVLHRVRIERERQDSKWGEQNHDAGKWMLILQEELGEAAKAKLEGNNLNYVEELIQSATVIVAWIEAELRRERNIDRYPYGESGVSDDDD
jgi:hypothetical protein